MTETTSTAAGHAPELYAHDAVAEPLHGFEAVESKHRQTYDSQGFLAIEQAFTPEEVEAAKQGLRDLALGKKPDFTGIQFEQAVRDKLDQLNGDQRLDGIRKLMHFVEYDERLKALSAHERLLDLVRWLLDGREPHMFQDMALSKPPSIGCEKPWHQDHAYFNLAQGERVVGVWIALDEAGLDNGCMHMMAGGHHHGPIHHWRRRDWQICDTDVYALHEKDYPVIAVPLRPGGLVVFDGLMPHGTPHNSSGKRRRALQYHYCAADAQWVDEAARLEVFGTEGKNVEC